MGMVTTHSNFAERLWAQRVARRAGWLRKGADSILKRGGSEQGCMTPAISLGNECYKLLKLV
jgi:hypothetical protein